MSLEEINPHRGSEFHGTKGHVDHEISNDGHAIAKSALAVCDGGIRRATGTFCPEPSARIVLANSDVRTTETVQRVVSKVDVVQERCCEVRLTAVVQTQRTRIFEVFAGEHRVHVHVVSGTVQDENGHGIFGNAARSKVISRNERVSVKHGKVDFVVCRYEQVNHRYLVEIRVGRGP